MPHSKLSELEYSIKKTAVSLHSYISQVKSLLEEYQVQCKSIDLKINELKNYKESELGISGREISRVIKSNTILVSELKLLKVKIDRECCKKINKLSSDKEKIEVCIDKAESILLAYDIEC